MIKNRQSAVLAHDGDGPLTAEFFLGAGFGYLKPTIFFFQIFNKNESSLLS